MHTIQSIAKMRTKLEEFRKNGESVALVPTMGYLHEGHAGLMRAAKKSADRVIVSAFINPLQFGLNENIHAYPQDSKRDSKICRAESIDVLFSPKIETFYGKNFSSFVSEESLTKTLGGPTRPHLFKGFSTCIIMLNNLVRPDFIVMGQRDIQQIAVVRKILQDFHISAKIITIPIIRSEEGLVLSAFTNYLEGTQKKEALKIFESLQKAKEMVNGGVRSVERVVAEVTHMFANCLKLRVNYIAIINPETLEALPKIVPGKSLMVLSVWIDQYRLNDNIML